MSLGGEEKVLEELYFSQNVIRKEKVNDLINTYCLDESTNLSCDGLMELLPAAEHNILMFPGEDVCVGAYIF